MNGISGLTLCAGALAGLLALGTPLPAYSAQAAARQDIYIPRGGLSDGLETLAIRFNTRILYDSRSVEDIETRPVRGRMTVEEALSQLLQDRSLMWERTGRDVLIVRPCASDCQPKTVELDPVVVSATRTPQSPRHVASSVSVITPAVLQDQQVDDLRSALAQQSGVIVSNTGNVGGTTSVYIRGAYPHHTLLIVDGLRMNDRAATYNNFMGGAGAENLEQIEILKGPQSPLYGSSAIGGVIVTSTGHGGGQPQGLLSVSAGTFDTRSADAVLTGSAGQFSYSASIGQGRTANDLPANGYEVSRYSTRLHYSATPVLSLGLTFRGQDSKYESVGSRYNPASGVASSANYLTTFYATWLPSDAMTSKLTMGYHRRDYGWSAPDVESDQTNRRFIIDWQNAWKPSEAVEVVSGANFETSDYDINGFLSEDRILSGFLSGIWRATTAVTLNAGARFDDYESVGNASTWRTGFAWMLRPGTKLHGTYGTGFAAPGSSDRYGVPAWNQLPNPDIRPETSKGWDIGIEHALLNGDMLLRVIYFKNTFTDLIDWKYIAGGNEEGLFVNRNRASTRGIETDLIAKIASSWHLQIGYTYLDARDDSSGARLYRRPQHTANLSAWTDLTDRWSVGFGAHHVSDTADNVGYATARAFASYALNARVTLKLRIENVFNKAYDEVYGYAGLPRGAHGSLSWNF